MNNTMQILLIEDHPDVTTVTAGRHMLQRHGAFDCIDAKSSELPMLKRRLDGAAPQLVILFGNRKSLDIFTALQLEFPDTRILVVAPGRKLNDYYYYLRGGAAGYLSYVDVVYGLPLAVEALQRESLLVNDYLKETLTAVPLRYNYSDPSVKAIVDSFTPREKVLLRLLRDQPGISTSAAARRLRVSRDTINKRLHSIFEKTNLSNRIALQHYLSGYVKD